MPADLVHGPGSPSALMGAPMPVFAVSARVNVRPYVGMPMFNLVDGQPPLTQYEADQFWNEIILK